MKPVYIFTIVALVLLGSGAVWFFSSSASLDFTDLPNILQNSPGASSTKQTSSQDSLSPGEVPAGQKEYRNDMYKFSLIHPEPLSVKEFNEGEGAMTITFENTETLEGFQIYVVPYEGYKVSEEQFVMDVPSGVREELTDVYVDGVLGTSFRSRHALLGDTREIWFIHEGYLYEATTILSQGDDMEAILTTWRFHQ
jgi:hypothetical protein